MGARQNYKVLDTRKISVSQHHLLWDLRMEKATEVKKGGLQHSAR